MKQVRGLDIEPFVRRLRTREQRGPSLGQEPEAFLRELVAAADDPRGLERYARACPVAGTRAQDYAPRVLDLGFGCRVIARIHFRGLDLAFPFVDVSAQSAPLPERLDPLLEAFAVFRPKALRIWQAPEEPLLAQSKRDVLVFAGHVPSLLALPAPRNAERVSLVFDALLESWDEYELAYRSLHAQEPELARVVQPEDRASLERCALAKAFFRVFVDARPAGFVAARPDRFRHWTGWCMVEVLLSAPFRGRGLGAALQFALLSRLDLRQTPHVFGTIDARNVPSQRTALRVGRQLVEGACFIPTTVRCVERSGD